MKESRETLHDDEDDHGSHSPEQERYHQEYGIDVLVDVDGETVPDNHGPQNFRQL